MAKCRPFFVDFTAIYFTLIKVFILNLAWRSMKNIYLFLIACIALNFQLFTYTTEPSHSTTPHEPQLAAIIAELEQKNAQLTEENKQLHTANEENQHAIALLIPLVQQQNEIIKSQQQQPDENKIITYLSGLSGGFQQFNFSDPRTHDLIFMQTTLSTGIELAQNNVPSFLHRLSTSASTSFGHNLLFLGFDIKHVNGWAFMPSYMLVHQMHESSMGQKIAASTYFNKLPTIIQNLTKNGAAQLATPYTQKFACYTWQKTGAQQAAQLAGNYTQTKLNAAHAQWKATEEARTAFAVDAQKTLYYGGSTAAAACVLQHLDEKYKITQTIEEKIGINVPWNAQFAAKLIASGLITKYISWQPYAATYVVLHIADEECNISKKIEEKTGISAQAQSLAKALASIGIINTLPYIQSYIQYFCLKLANAYISPA
jgi:hypothetical protein